MFDLWGRFVWWLAQGQNSAATQAIVAIAQAILTVLALFIAIVVPAWQTHSARVATEKDAADRLRNLRIALREEVLLFSQQCKYAFDTFAEASRHGSFFRMSLRSIIFPPLVVFESNASQIGLLKREEAVSLLGFSGTLFDLRTLATNPADDDQEMILGMLKNACLSSATFLEAIPDLPEERVKYAEYIRSLRDVSAREQTS
jgi:hypothetical protein